MSVASWVGFTTAAFLTTIAFLPQIIKVWRTRSTGDISLIAANAVTLALASIILHFKIRQK